LKALKIVGVFLVLTVSGALFAQDHLTPILHEEPQYTFGTTNTLYWGPATLASDTSIIAYEIQIQQEDSTFRDSLSIFPIPAVDVRSLSYEVGLGRTGGGIDRPLVDGVRYCYRIRYRYRVREGEFDFSNWSNIVCSTQDASAPTGSLTELPIWTNTVNRFLHFDMSDRVCRGVESVKLYYRRSDGDPWVMANEMNITPSRSPVSDSILFNSDRAGGDGYYQFYLSGEDSLGNGYSPIATDVAMAWTRFDTRKPFSSISSSGMNRYYTTPTVRLSYTAGDTGVPSGVDSVILYYTYQGEPETRYNAHTYGGVINISGEFVFVCPRGDGRYGFYTIAHDSAGNYETSTGEDIFFFLDTHNPLFESANMTDTTSAISRFQTFAEPGWTNERYIYISLLSPLDPPVPYASGIDSVIVALDSAMTEGLRKYRYVEGGRYLYQLPAGDGVKGVYVWIVDVAGNKSEPKYTRINLDTIAPEFVSINLSDIDLVSSDTTNSTSVRVSLATNTASGVPYKMYITQNPASLNSIPNSAWVDYRSEFVFELRDVSPMSWVTLYAVCKDSAGNISNEVRDSIFYNPLRYKTVDLISVRDPDGPDTTGRYTNNFMIDVRISYGRDIDSIAIWDNASSPHYIAAPRPSGTDTVVDFAYTLAPGDGVREVRCMGKSNYDPANPTPQDALSIILDTYSPRLDSLIVSDMTSGFDFADTAEEAYHGWTNRNIVRVEFLNPRDERTGIRACSIVSGSASATHPFTTRIFQFTLPDGDGAKMVTGTVQDSAGNWSSDARTLIKVDTHRPKLDSIVIADASTDDINYTDTTYVKVRCYASDTILGANPLFIAFFEDTSLYPSRLGSLWRPFAPVLEYEFSTPVVGVKTLYAAVKDSAGNISRLNYDTIILSHQLLLRIRAYDRTTIPRDSIYTNEPTVLVRFSWMGSPPVAYLLSETPRVAPDPLSPEWQHYPSGDTVFFTFTDASEGRKMLYGWVMNSAGVISPVDSVSIILDMTPPEIVDGLIVFDTTSTNIIPATFVASPGWANEQYVVATSGSLIDNFSGVDSIMIFGEIQGDTLRLAYDPSRRIPIILRYDTLSSSRQITIAGRDGATNWGSERYPNSTSRVNFRLDMIRPTIRFVLDASGSDSVAQPRPRYLPVEFFDGPELGYPAVAYIWVSGFSETLVVRADSSWSAESNPRVLQVRFDLADNLEFNTLYNISAVVVDSAGNPSNVANLKLWVIPDTISVKLTLYDTVDTTDSEYTRHQTVKAKIFTRVPAEMMRISTSRTFEDANWVPYASTIDFTFPDMRNERKWVYCQVMQSGFLSVIDSASIILDTIPPTFDGIVARDHQTNNPNWSGSYSVRVSALNPADQPPGTLAGILLAEDSTFTKNRQYIPFAGADYAVLYELTPQEEGNEQEQGNTRVIYARIIDRAENESDTKSYRIIVDVEKEEKVVNYPNPFNPEKEATQIRIKPPKGNETLKIKIYDQFGNIVWTKELKATNTLVEVEWDGKNDKGKVVANGGYICIVDIDGKTVKGKIGVWKGTK